MSESMLEYLSPLARIECIREANRVLRHGGRLADSIGNPIGIGEDGETRMLLETHPYFGKRNCNIFSPIDIRVLLDALGFDEFPSDSGAFPGFVDFKEDLISGNPNFLFDRFCDHPDTT